MKKNELVHLHALLACVARDLVDRGVADAEAFAAYRALGVTSRSLRASRDDHEAAVRALADAVSSAAADGGDGDGDADCGSTDGTRLSFR